MARSVLTLTVIGLGIVHALPASRPLGDRQVIWGGSGTFTPGQPGSAPTPCISGSVPPGTDVSPCFVGPPITGGLNPPKEKRQGGFGFGGGSSSSEKEKAIAALELQLLALKSKPDPTDDDLAQIAALEALILYTEGITSISAPPGVNTSLTHGNRKRFTLPPDSNANRNQAIDELERELEELQNKEFQTEEDIADIQAIQEILLDLINVVSISAPPGTSTTFHPGKQRRFTLPPDAHTNINKAIDELERRLERLQNQVNKTAEDRAEIEDIKAALKYLVGITSIIAPPGSSSTFHPGKARRFTLPPDANTNIKKAIDELEKQLEALQNKPFKSSDDRAEIEDIKAALRYLAGITSISAPPGSSSTFHPGKVRRFTLPPDANTNIKKAIDELERQLEALQNKPFKSNDDRSEIEDIKAALRYLAGVTSISAPPGSSSTFHPGKREALTDRSVDAISSLCPGVDAAEIALETLLHNSHPSKEEAIAIEQLKRFLKGCGITIVQSPDGTWTTIKPSDKMKARSLEPEADTSFDLDGSSLASTATTPVAPSKRQTGSPVIGTRVCQLADLLHMKESVYKLVEVYGQPSQSPFEVLQLEQLMVKILLICGVPMPGWSVSGGSDPIPVGTINPDPLYPGGTINPDPTTPGGSINPDPTIPGSPVKPSDRRAVLNASPSELMTALRTLEEKYGAYGSGTVPKPVEKAMEHIILALIQILGHQVPGYPVLGDGSTTIGPST